MVVYEDYARDSRVRRHARMLVRAGRRVRVLALGTDSAASAAQRDGVDLVRIASRKYRGRSRGRYVVAYVSFALRMFVNLLRSVSQERIGLVWVNNPPDALVFAALPARLRGVPIVLDVHDMTSELFAAKFESGGGSPIGGLVRIVETFAYRFADGIITVHPGYAERISARVRKPVIDVLNSPDDDTWVAVGDGRSTAPAGRTLVLGHHGTIVERFGLDLAVRAVADARGRGLDVVLRILGDGDFAPAVERLIADLGVSDAVLFDRRVFEPADIRDFAAGLDIGVAPYRRSAFIDDAVPVKVLEYITLGIPVISTPTRALRRLLDDGVVRFLPAASSDAVLDAIVELADPETRARYQAATRPAARAIAWRQQEERLLAWLSVLLDGTRRHEAGLDERPMIAGGRPGEWRDG